MKRIGSGLFIVFLALGTACGGGGGSDGGVVGSGIDGSFVPDQPSPGSNTVAMSQGAASGEVVTVRISVTDVSGVYGAAFDVTYDANKARFEGWSPGTLLEQGGHSPNYIVDSPQPGRVVVGASRTGSVPGADANGTRPLINLTFRVQQTGSNRVSFTANPSLSDSQLPPQDIPGLSWASGSLVGS